MERQRIRRFERLPAPEIALTPRDIRLLWLLWRCRFVDTRQLQRLFGRRIQRRLTLLYRKGYVDRPRAQRLWRQREEGGSKPIVYALTNLGAQVLEAQGYEGAAATNWDRHNAQLSRYSLTIPHALCATEMVLAILLSCERHGWECVVHPCERLGEKGSSVVPDGVVEVVGRAMLYLEADRAHEPIARRQQEALQSLKGKFERYQALLKGTQGRKRVLVATTGGERRARNIATASQSGLVLSCPIEKLSQEDALTAPIWYAQDGTLTAAL